MSVYENVFADWSDFSEQDLPANSQSALLESARALPSNIRFGCEMQCNHKH
jgi:hypothetical protein